MAEQANQEEDFQPVDANTFGGLPKFQAPEIVGEIECVVKDCQLLANPKDITVSSYTSRDGGEIKRRGYKAKVRVIFGDFPKDAKDKSGRDLNALGFDVRSDFTGTAYLDDMNGNPLPSPYIFMLEEDTKTNKAGEGGKLVKLARARFGAEKVKTAADVPALLKGKRVIIKNKPTLNPGTGDVGPKAVITAIL